jgi:hypothetical protein
MDGLWIIIMKLTGNQRKMVSQKRGTEENKALNHQGIERSTSR